MPRSEDWPEKFGFKGTLVVEWNSNLHNIFTLRSLFYGKIYVNIERHSVKLFGIFFEGTISQWRCLTVRRDEMCIYLLTILLSIHSDVKLYLKNTYTESKTAKLVLK